MNLKDQTTHTFEEEFNFLFDYVREALDLESENKQDEVSSHFNNNVISNRQIDSTDIRIDQLSENFYDFFLQPETISDKGYPHNNPLTVLINSAAESNIPKQIVRDLFLNLGTEAFGMYLPMHRFFRNKYTAWGIYLFPEIIGPHVKELSSKYKTGITDRHFLEYYIWLIYRHELFHFQTEHFATANEVLMVRPYYLLYEQNIYHKYSNSADWLEEALAEASVLESRLVSNRLKIKINTKRMKKIYRADLDKMPSGYRDYHCRTYGGAKEAHKNLAAQIIHGDIKIPKPTAINTIKRGYAYNHEKVPTYIVTGLQTIEKIQIENLPNIVQQMHLPM